MDITPFLHSKISLVRFLTVSCFSASASASAAASPRHLETAPRTTSRFYKLACNLVLVLQYNIYHIPVEFSKFTSVLTQIGELKPFDFRLFKQTIIRIFLCCWQIFLKKLVIIQIIILYFLIVFCFKYNRRI